MKFQKVSLYLSNQRIDRYLAATGNNKTKANRLYKANLKIAQAFHPLLGILEVTLRNRINAILTAHFADPDWIINQKYGFMNSPSLTNINRRTRQSRTNDFLKSSVEKAERRIRRLRIPIASCKIIADQALGFWTDLFELHHYRLLLGKPIQIFNHLPSGYGRSEVCKKLNNIRRFRNRINHNEPICFRGNTIDFTYAEEIYNECIEILEWIDPELISWIGDIDAVKIKIANAKTIQQIPYFSSA
ncbi:Abi-like protein [Chitinophaga sp. CF118]|uniref:Abi family protein n=1 Tax=Chitinophaga sp. CF118 TaxID=1884367 RepID=UPI0008F23973|nr:Abi family protein [Chitinophaga sp. CF118]SFD77186.1 Abi-like protein [Chitinophaga sp. CF118]